MEQSSAKLDKTGRLLIPSQFRKQMGLSPGSEVLVDYADGELRVYTREHALRKAQVYFRSFVPPGVSVVDEFLAEKREEARREREDLEH